MLKDYLFSADKNPVWLHLTLKSRRSIFGVTCFHKKRIWLKIVWDLVEKIFEVLIKTLKCPFDWCLLYNPLQVL